jgi:hypothetical protein
VATILFVFFLANGSSVSLEIGGKRRFRVRIVRGRHRPECKSPRDVVLYELANEQLVEEAFTDDHPSTRWSLIKANMDGEGHTLGQHELVLDMGICAAGMDFFCGGWALVLLFAWVVLYRFAAMIWIGLWCIRYLPGYGVCIPFISQPLVSSFGATAIRN